MTDKHKVTKAEDEKQVLRVKRGYFNALKANGKNVEFRRCKK